MGESVAALESYCRRERIDGVLVQSEAAMLAGSLLLQRLGLPGIAPEAAFRCANKWLCRSLLAEAGVPQPAFALARDAASVLRFARGRFPVILKGIASTMSRLVMKVNSAAGVEPALERMRAGLACSTDIARLAAFSGASGLDAGCDPRRDFLVEEFLEGLPVETDGFVIDNVPTTFGVTEQVMSPPPLFYIEGYLLPHPSAAGIERVSDAALRALDLNGAGFSIELRSRGETAAVIEVNGRLGEDDGFAELFRAATGRDTLHQAIDLALGRKVKPGGVRGGFCALAYRCWYRDGVVQTVPSREQILALEEPGVAIGISVYPGAQMHAPPHPETFPHLAWALARHTSSSREAYLIARRIVDTLPFKLESCAS